MSPGSPGLQRVSISRQAILILFGAFCLAFSITVLLLLTVPHLRVNETDRRRLAQENQTLTIENRNISLGIEKLNSRVSHIEETAKQIDDLIQTQTD
jgi:hypothetical protein